MTTFETLLSMTNERRFEEAAKFLSQYKEHERIEMLLKLAKQQTSQGAYSIAEAMLERKESSFWHRAAARISETFADKKEGRKRSLHHLLKAIETEPMDWKLKEEALAYHRDGLLPESYIRPFAESVLKQEPTNQLALMAIETEIELI